MKKKYQIVENENIVTGFSNFRLPFMPNEEALAYRDNLKRSISNLQLHDNQILMAKYMTSNVGFFDVENILFYNIGASSFKDICRNGIIMEFELDKKSINLDFDHIIEYQIIDIKSDLKPRTQKYVASFDFKIPSLTAKNRVSDYWFAMHSGSINLNQLHLDSINDFGLFVELETGQRNFNIVSIMKSLIDGIISGYHSESNEDLCAEERLTNMLHKEMSKVTEYLQNDKYAILGKRNLVSTYRNNVKWNPADDKCKEMIIIPRFNDQVEDVKIKGDLYMLDTEQNYA